MTAAVPEFINLGRSCSIDGCEKPAKCRGWCSAHYARWKRGTPHAVCSVVGCELPVQARGWCEKHYQRWRANGSVHRNPPTVSERFWAKVDKTGGCWLWTAGKDVHGYGLFRVNRKNWLAHRWAWTQAHGAVPEGLELDHLCRTPACVRPDHLEPVTHAENVRRGRGGDWARSKTHCPQGHPYDESNTYYPQPNRRICRACSAAHGRAYRRRLKEQAK